ncbi:cell cycle checkpoint [Dendrothele bispora CBS 962.96]|uniref:Checkpoint protein n=1 Tax=Dendrothele bispora (strain CBS 962.96) TaxID=1314807 RepID=A0A4V4HGD1_DENBC|nr:cell cycle checkpoint [Dendrothele bispora CBS 962.96]
MRFRTLVDNIPTFFRVIQSIEKLQKRCYIKFTETNMQIICNHDSNEGGIQVWSQIKVSSLFSDYRIQSTANNEIIMRVSPEALVSALRSAAPNVTGSGGTGGNVGSIETDEVIMKLAKKNDQAVLSFEIKGFSGSGRRVRLTQDVRVDVEKIEALKLNEPMCPEPDIRDIVSPPLVKLRTIVDRMKGMADFLTFRANHSGHMKLEISSDMVRVETEWKSLSAPNMNNLASQDQDQETEKDPDKFFSVVVSIRSFLKFLSSHVISSTTIACICQNHCLILYVYIGDVADAGGVLTYYVPAIIEDD